MTHSMPRLVLFFAFFGFVATLFAPMDVEAKAKKAKPRYRMSVSAIPGADEKEFRQPVSRCLTKEMMAIRDRAEKQMQQEIKKFGAGFEEAGKKYQEQFQLIWSAMSEPYCGYGSRGMRAVKKSFVKSLARTRQEFLKRTKPASRSTTKKLTKS